MAELKAARQRGRLCVKITRSVSRSRATYCCRRKTLGLSAEKGFQEQARETTLFTRKVPTRTSSLPLPLNNVLRRTLCPRNHCPQGNWQAPRRRASRMAAAVSISANKHTCLRVTETEVNGVTKLHFELRPTPHPITREPSVGLPHVRCCHDPNLKLEARSRRKRGVRLWTEAPHPGK